MQCAARRRGQSGALIVPDGGDFSPSRTPFTTRPYFDVGSSWNRLRVSATEFDEPRILRPLLAVHVGGDVPRILIAQRAAESERHVGLDEARGVVDRGHACAPVERARSPQRRKHGLPVGRLLSLAVGAMTERAMLCVDFGAAIIVRRLSGCFQLGITLALDSNAGRTALRQEVGIGLQRDEHLVVERRRLAVHAELETALQPLLKGIHVAVLRAIGRVEKIGGSQRRGVRLAAAIDMTVRALQIVADEFLRIVLGIMKDRLAEPDHLTERPFGNVAVRRRRIGGAGFRLWCRRLLRRCACQRGRRTGGQHVADETGGRESENNRGRDRW